MAKPHLENAKQVRKRRGQVEGKEKNAGKIKVFKLIRRFWEGGLRFVTGNGTGLRETTGGDAVGIGADIPRVEIAKKIHGKGAIGMIRRRRGEKTTSFVCARGEKKEERV